MLERSRFIVHATRAVGKSLSTSGLRGVWECSHRCASASALPALSESPQEDDKENHHTFYARDMVYEFCGRAVDPADRSTRAANLDLETVKFGTVFTDHMFMAQHNQASGWEYPRIKPFAPLSIHPAAQVLHYGMTCFEGMKAYRGVDGKARLFRPERNMNRLLSSASRLQLATFDPNELLECVKSLVRVDAEWLPNKEGHSLYIRPFAFSSAHVLGVAPPTQTTLSVIMSPVGPYFPNSTNSLQSISLFIEERARRAWPGGVGCHKVGGNYAPTIQPQLDASTMHGAHQVVYTHQAANNEDDAEFEECGAMNVFFFLENAITGRLELATPDLGKGTILPGITRDSILSLAREWGEFDVSERPVTMIEIQTAVAQGRLKEVFGSGTACIVQPVDALIRANGDVWRPVLRDPTSEESLARRLQKTLLDIQYGRTPHSWSHVVE